jgi:hypothetical protein
MEEDSALTHAITLIHGTFATDAEWVRPCSRIRKELAAVHGEHCLFVPFLWNGANNNFERMLAAQDLIGHLEAIEAAHRNIRHILIAHSHGGSLALQAVTHGTLSRPVDGICCLATPFFHARLHDGAELSGNFLRRVILALLSVPYLIVSMVVAIPLLWSFVYLLAAFFVSVAVGGFLSGGGMALRPAAENIVHWTHARSPTSNLKILRAPGDEASLVLSIGQLTAWASRLSIEKLARAEKKNPFYVVKSQKLPSFIGKAALVLSILAVITFALAFVAPTVAIALLPWLLGAAVGLFLLVLLIKTTLFDRYLFGLAVIARIVSLLLNRLLIGTSMPKRRREGAGMPFTLFTISAWLLALMIEINAESAPEGEWRVDMLPPLAGSAFSDLSHSIYNHPVAIERVVEWVGITRSQVGMQTEL